MNNNYGCLFSIFIFMCGLFMDVFKMLSIKEWAKLLLLTGVVSIIVIGIPKLILKVIAKSKKKKIEEDITLSFEDKATKIKQVENDSNEKHSATMKSIGCILVTVVIIILMMAFCATVWFIHYIIEGFFGMFDVLY